MCYTIVLLLLAVMQLITKNVTYNTVIFYVQTQIIYFSSSVVALKHYSIYNMPH